MSFESKNPTTGELLGTYPEHSAHEVELRLQSAWDGWKKLVAYAALRADGVSHSPGGSSGEARRRVCAADHAGDGQADRGGARRSEEGRLRRALILPKRVRRISSLEAIPGTPGRVVYESLGPILAIMPWNLPFWQVLRFFIPAALVGNTVVVKHAETVQGCALALESLVQDAGGPEGLYVNLSVQRSAVPAIIADPRIRAVTVTGSVQAGRAVAQQAGLHGKKVVLELGGSDPFIVLEDADIAKAVQLGVTSRYSNNAQSCIAAKRFLIAEPIADAFIKAFVEQASALKVGDPLLPDTKLGPQAREDLRATTERQVSDAMAAGGACAHRRQVSRWTRLFLSSDGAGRSAPRRAGCA